MFLLRSAFWLTVAFIAIRPGVDFKGTADALTADAMAAGQQIIAEQILKSDCTDLPCVGTKAAISVVLSSTPSAAAPMQAQASGPVPFPRPRPDWMG